MTNYVRLMRERLEDRNAFIDAMYCYSAILTPSVPMAAPVVAQIDQNSAPSQFTRMANHLGFCALATPMGLAESRLPASLHILGRGGDEATVLRIGAAYNEAVGNIGRPPGWG